MNEERRAQAKSNALARFADSGPDRINCAQAVLAYSLEVMEQDPGLATTAAYFGGGIAGMGNACGAITGAVLAAGMRDYHAAKKDPERTQRTKEGLQEAMRGFVEEFGSCRCNELTGYDVSTPEGFAAFKASEAKDRCPIFVEWMMDEIAPLIDPEES